MRQLILCFVCVSGIAFADLISPRKEPLRLGVVRAIEFPAHWKDFGFEPAKNCAQVVAYRLKTGEKAELLELAPVPCPADGKAVEKPRHRFIFRGNVAEGSTEGGTVLSAEGRRRHLGSIGFVGKTGFRLYDFCEGPKAAACNVEIDEGGKLASIEIKAYRRPSLRED